MKLALLTTCDNTIKANLIRTKLEAEGVLCFLNNEHFTSLMPHFYNMMGSGVRVMVPEEDLDKAREIMPVNTGKIRCPNCDSGSIVNKNESIANKLMVAFIGIFFLSPVGNLINNYTCTDCRQQFKP
jgi:DNA-directed RNA polymerase subunit RPC12/RpoP